MSALASTAAASASTAIDASATTPATIVDATSIASAAWNPYGGLPLPVQLALLGLLLVALMGLVMVTVLLVQSARERRRQARAVEGADESGFLWVYVVPALDEEVTIRDSVTRLAAVEASNKIVLVIDDGSEDSTPTILAALAREMPGLHVLRRTMPNARNGKSAGLDDAWRHLHEDVLLRPEYRRWSTDRVIIGVVDADGRIAPDSPPAIAAAFADERVGGVQSLVRIYNRRHALTWAQHIEFAITAHVFQLGRSRWGTANMGGNGQYVRLAALDDVVAEDHLPREIDRGPWRDRLTEDQDIGIRLVRAGWRGAQTVLTAVEQQGVTSLRRLWRQRIRWAQGAWQSVPMLRGAGAMDASVAARVDHAHYLLTPVLQVVMSLGLVGSLWLFVVEGVPWAGGGMWFVVAFVVLATAPVYAALVTIAPAGVLRPLVALGYLLPYLAYTWVLWPVFAISLAREAVGVRSWAKTAREPLDAHLSGVEHDFATGALALGAGVAATAAAAAVGAAAEAAAGAASGARAAARPTKLA